MNTNTIVTIPNEVVMSKILFIRGRKVMLDKDLAELYQVETRLINQAVKRNRERFPPDFMFQLSEQETAQWQSEISRSQTVILKHGKNIKIFNTINQLKADRETVPEEIPKEKIGFKMGNK